MSEAVYVLCALTSALCAVLLLRSYARTRTRLLLWSSASFLVFSVANVLLVLDLVLFPGVNLALIRAVAGFVSMSILLFGLVWDV
jgi:hypothetical protein